MRVSVRGHARGARAGGALWCALVAGAGVARGAAEGAPVEPGFVAGTSGEGRWRGAVGREIEAASRAWGAERVAGIPVARLEALNLGALALEDALLDAPGMPMRIGVGAAVAEGDRAGAWFDEAGGERVWALDLACEGAVGMRVLLSGMDLAPGVEVVVSEVGADGRTGRSIGAWGGRGLWGAGEMWTGTAWSGRVRIEVRGAGARGGAAPVVVDSAQRIYRGGGAGGVTDELACHADVTCFPEWAEVARATGRYSFISGGQTFVCTGQLLNTTTFDLTPYFLTANHCVSTAGVAQTAEISWLYQTSVCNGAAPNLAAAARSLGMTLVDAFSPSDYSLSIVDGALPEGVSWVGWETTSVATSTPLVGVHHPGGSYKRIAMGTKAPAATCRNETNFFGVNWTVGLVEPGSSGSGIYRASTKALVGQLFGTCVTAACDTLFAVYGAFWRTYPFISSHLTAGPDDSFEPNGSCAQAAPIGLGAHAGLVVKSGNDDWFAYPLAPGRRVLATAAFEHDHGDVDLESWTSCEFGPGNSSRTSADSETVIVLNPGPGALTVRLRVFLSSSTRNDYALTLSEEAVCVGDVNADGVVDFVDLNLLLGQYASSGPVGSLPADINYDGVVDFFDLNLLLGFYGGECAR